MLELHNIHLSAGERLLANDISLSLEAGKMHVLIGPNGTGKSTLLKAIFAEVSLNSGDIQLDQQSFTQRHLSQWRRLFSYMPQDINLNISLTALEVVLLGNADSLSLHLDQETIEKGLHALEQVGLLALANRKVNTLSGGQCQMVLFAQALMRSPRIVMLDEPVSALDLYYQQVLLERLSQETKKNQWITLVVLHDLNLAAQYADNLIVLNNAQVKAHGAPSNVMTKALIESVYQVEAQIMTDTKGQPFVRTYGHIPATKDIHRV